MAFYDNNSDESINSIIVRVEINKAVNLNENSQVESNEGVKSYFGFSIAGGIDQDYKQSPQKFPDNGIYVTTIKQNSPASKSNLKLNDKILQVNGFDFTQVTHQKAVECIQKGKFLNMIVTRKCQKN